MQEHLQMKNTIVLSFFLCFIVSSCAMVPVVNNDDRLIANIPKEHLEASGTLKDMISDLKMYQSLPLPEKVSGDEFKALIPYLEEAAELQKKEDLLKQLEGDNSVEEENFNTRKKALSNQLSNDKNLDSIISASNTLNVPTVFDLATTICAKRLFSEKMDQFKEKGGFKLPFVQDVQRVIGSKMLDIVPGRKISLLLREKIINSGDGKMPPLLKKHDITLPLNDSVAFAAISNTGKTLAAQGEKTTIALFSTATGKLIAHTGLVGAEPLALSEKFIAVKDYNNSTVHIKKWDATAQKIAGGAEDFLNVGDGLRMMVFSSSNQLETLHSVAWSPVLKKWDCSTKKPSEEKIAVLNPDTIKIEFRARPAEDYYVESLATNSPQSLVAFQSNCSGIFRTQNCISIYNMAKMKGAANSGRADLYFRGIAAGFDETGNNLFTFDNKHQLKQYGLINEKTKDQLDGGITGVTADQAGLLMLAEEHQDRKLDKPFELPEKLKPIFKSLPSNLKHTITIPWWKPILWRWRMLKKEWTLLSAATKCGICISAGLIGTGLGVTAWNRSKLENADQPAQVDASGNSAFTAKLASYSIKAGIGVGGISIFNYLKGKWRDFWDC